jgi:hypothetical protein
MNVNPAIVTDMQRDAVLIRKHILLLAMFLVVFARTACTIRKERTASNASRSFSEIHFDLLMITMRVVRVHVTNAVLF